MTTPGPGTMATGKYRTTKSKLECPVGEIPDNCLGHGRDGSTTITCAATKLYEDVAAVILRRAMPYGDREARWTYQQISIMPASIKHAERSRRASSGSLVVKMSETQDVQYLYNGRNLYLMMQIRRPFLCPCIKNGQKTSMLRYLVIVTFMHMAPEALTFMLEMQ